jgi:excisionase family DNA binding protein
MNSTSKLMTPEQVAEILQVHVLTVYSYIKKGKFDAIRLGRSYRIDPQDLDTFVKSNKSSRSPAQ